MKLVYLDNAASTKISSGVLEKMMESYSENYGNPSSTHKLGQKARAAIETARSMIAGYIGVESKEIIFTSGGAEGNNLAIRGALNAYSSKGKHIITSKIEHSTVLKTCQQLENEGYEVTYIDVDENGVINLEQLKNSIRKDTVIVSIMYANNETGVKQPIEEIGQILENTDIIFHTDAVQAMCKEKIFPKDLKIGAMTVTAHKFYGPKGAGFVYLDKKFQVEKEIWGGSQERNRRAGTENLQGILGLGTAMEEAYENMDKIEAMEEEIHEYLERRLKNEIEDIKINGEKSPRLKTITNLCLKGCDIQTLLIALDLRGICVSGGSACMSGAHEDSHVLKEMGLNSEELKSSFRISIGKDTTIEEIDYFVENLKEIAKIERGI
ncbi:putative cysteine desulfurase [Leptotrichia sp. oral taxon 215 str. W9775]|uniref:cysteine desulfurase family protein n=1 Tax=Leptotrichia sp. oral taxon 215 TaxID=712359 RepID=UPI0003ADF85A|nr:cysteine desulfurase family protein [Leptotrichia sp. oral taxon 215]ERK69110.1 putative cysteine desulfurase [Leptotrichia sp. oral taxon 215 str. W9775]